MGHQVRLIKNDAADARAIWLAVQQPGRPVAVKTEAQQAVLALHRMRQQGRHRLFAFRSLGKQYQNGYVG
jgi:transposase